MGERFTGHVEIVTGRPQRIGDDLYEDAELSLATLRGRTIQLDGRTATVDVGGVGTDGDVIVRDAAGTETVVVDGNTATVTVGAVVIGGKDGSIAAGGNGVDGHIAMRAAGGQEIVTIDAGGVVDVGGNGVDAVVRIRRADGQERITLDGRTGNVRLFGDVEMWGADLAEQFDVVTDTTPIAEGTVVVLAGDGGVTPCSEMYDRRVAGIVSGAGDRRAAIVLDRRQPSPNGRRLPVAVVGKAWCLADASEHPIRVGDLLTTSDLPGHARRAVDPVAAFGAVLGKAMTPLDHGRGQVLVLVGLS